MTDTIHNLRNACAELRMAMMKMSDKVDKLLEKNQNQNQNQSQNQNSSENNKTSKQDLEQNVKKVMNKMFKQLKSEIDPTKTYSGDEVLQLVAVCVKSTTESLLMQTNK